MVSSNTLVSPSILGSSGWLPCGNVAPSPRITSPRQRRSRRGPRADAAGSTMRPVRDDRRRRSHRRRGRRGRRTDGDREAPEPPREADRTSSVGRCRGERKADGGETSAGAAVVRRKPRRRRPGPAMIPGSPTDGRSHGPESGHRARVIGLSAHSRRPPVARSRYRLDIIPTLSRPRDAVEPAGNPAGGAYR
jgi:hypothetical protein